MEPTKAIELGKDAEKSLREHKFIDHADAVKLGSEALHRLLTMRSYNINQAILPLPSERPIEDLAPSADRKRRLRESPLGREPLKLSECPFERLRDYPGCYEDCPDVEQCPLSKKSKG